MATPNYAVLIAPKGEDYSSISDETFMMIQGYHVFLELAIEEFGAWMITADSLTGEFTQFSYDGSTTAHALVEMKRYKRGTDEVMDFEGLAPGHTTTLYLAETDFKITPDEGSDPAKGIVGSFWLAFRLFYHRDKFYYCYNNSVSGLLTPSSQYSHEWTFTPTSIKLEITYIPASNPPYTYRIHEYTLNT